MNRIVWSVNSEDLLLYKAVEFSFLKWKNVFLHTLAKNAKCKHNVNANFITKHHISSCNETVIAFIYSIAFIYNIAFCKP